MISTPEVSDRESEREALLALERSFPLAGVAVALLWLLGRTAVEPTLLTDPAAWSGVVGIVWGVTSLFVVVGFCFDPDAQTVDQTYLAPIALGMTPGGALLLAVPAPAGGVALIASVIGLIGLLVGMLIGASHVRRRSRSRRTRNRRLRHG